MLRGRKHPHDIARTPWWLIAFLLALAILSPVAGVLVSHIAR